MPVGIKPLPAVKKLQSRLQELGFDPGPIDGKLGPATLRAVKAFQKSCGLEVDGIVGPKTRAALQEKAPDTPADGKGEDVLADAVTLASIADITPALVSKMFPGVPLKNLEENLPFVLAALAQAALADRDMILMALATIRAETGNFTPLSEFKSKFNTTPQGPPFNRYDNRKDLGNLGPPDGNNFKGRGYIQLTGRDNYKVHGAAIGLGNKLIEDPTLANQPDIAAKLLASFLKSKEQKIRVAILKGDLKTARKLVNGGSHGLKEFTVAFNIGRTLIA